MRITKIYCNSVKMARDCASWAKRLIKHRGVFIAFESEDDFRCWMKVNLRKGV